MTIPFQYQPLDRSKREIRLLKLFPRNQWVKDLLPTFSMFQTNIDQCPPYFALSYVWGDQSDQRPIILDGHTLKVTKNLFEALIGIVESEIILIWIDAICINQADYEEKGWQVALMGDIYRKTYEVLAWLGPSANNSDGVLDHMNVLGSIAESCDLLADLKPCKQVWKEISRAWPNDWNPSDSSSSLNMQPTQIRRLKILLHAIGGLKHHKYLIKPASLNDLFERPWWGRIWVLQEISLPEQAQFVCGRKRISRGRFHAAFEAYHALLDVLQYKIQQGQFLSNYQKEFTHMNPRRVHLMLSTSDVYKENDFTLAEMLRATNYRYLGLQDKQSRPSLDATDPRDKIFALLNIVNDREELEAFGVFPDYTKSKEEVYTTAMVAMLRLGHISLLSEARGVERRDGLASWVPDWSTPTSGTLQYSGTNFMNPEPRFGACGLNKEASIMSGNRNDEINIFGTICDRILYSAEVSRISDLVKIAQPLEWLRVMIQLARFSRELCPSSEMLWETAARVLHAGMRFNTNGLPERAYQFPHTIQLLEKIIHSMEGNQEFPELQEAIRQLKSVDPVNNAVRDLKEAIFDLSKVSCGRTLFVTEQGRLGICSMGVETGDFIALMGGVEIPFILRNVVGERFTIVSEAYVDGIMDGEAAEGRTWDFIRIE